MIAPVPTSNNKARTTIRSFAFFDVALFRKPDRENTAIPGASDATQDLANTIRHPQQTPCFRCSGNACVLDPAYIATSKQLALRAVIFVVFALLGTSLFAQEIILRDLSRIANASVTSATDESLTLADGKQLSWDRVLQARVDPAWQKAVDDRIEKFGLPLYRLKHRLRQQNYDGAFEISRDWYDNDQNMFAGADANFLVCRSVMLGRIARGENGKAVEAMIRALELQDQCSKELLDSIEGITFEESELKTQLCRQLLPVWSTAEESRSQLSKLDDQFDLQTMVQKWPGLGVYLSSMAIHSGQRERMTQWNSAMGAVPLFRPWQRILNSDLSRGPLSRFIGDTDGSLRVTTMYWWATAEDQQAENPERVLTLLKIVANYQDQFPSLAKESLAQAVELTDDPDVKAALIGR